MKIITKIKAAIVSMMMLFPSVPVMATTEYPGHDYPEMYRWIPVIYLPDIDLTNNQIKIIINTMSLSGKTVSRISAGWVSDYSNPEATADILSYETLDVDWAVKALDVSAGELNTYLAKEVGIYNIYIVDALVDLKENRTLKMFYIVDFTDGTKWINDLSFPKCIGWTEGQKCTVTMYTQEKYHDNVQYILGAAQEKFIRTIPEPEPVVEPEPTPEPEPTSEPEPVVESEPTPEPEPVLEPEPTSEPEPVLELINDPATEPKTETETVVEPQSKPATEPVSSLEPDTQSEATTVETPRNDENENENEIVVASAPQTIDTVKVEKVSTDTDEEYIDYDELTESPEGPGETTLDVPMLGEPETIEVDQEEFNWLPVFIAGVAVGAILTWFLFSIIHSMRYKRDL